MAKVITFWSPVSRQGACSTNAALFFSYLPTKMLEVEKAVLFSLNSGVDAVSYVTDNLIRQGITDLIYLKETNNLRTKEDILAYTHKLDNSLDIMGTGKDEKMIRENYKEIVEILSVAYDWIIIDCMTCSTEYVNELLNQSDVLVVCLPQDRFACETFSQNISILGEAKVILVCSNYNEKSSFTLEMMEILFPYKIYKINNNIKIAQVIDSQSISQLFSGKKARSVSYDVDEVYKESIRLMNISSMDIDYSLVRKKRTNASIIEDSKQDNVKVVKEYSFIRTKNNVMIVNASKSAGSTFITLNLSYYLKNRHSNVSVIEIPDVLNNYNDIFYELFSTDSDQYISVAQNIVNNELTGNPLCKNGINFYINNTIINKWELDDNIKFINYIGRSSAINLYDIGSRNLNDEIFKFMLNLTDTIITVIDPVPYKILQAEKRIQQIKNVQNKNLSVVYILNKHVKDINTRDIEKYFDIKISSTVPFIGAETVYAAAYGETVVYGIKKDDVFKNSLTDIVANAGIIVEKERENLNIISKIRERLKR